MNNNLLDRVIRGLKIGIAFLLLVTLFKYIFASVFYWLYADLTFRPAGGIICIMLAYLTVLYTDKYLNRKRK